MPHTIQDMWKQRILRTWLILILFLALVYTIEWITASGHSPRMNPALVLFKPFTYRIMHFTILLAVTDSRNIFLLVFLRSFLIIVNNLVVFMF